MFDQIREALDKLSGKQKLQMLIAVIALGGVIYGISSYATRIRYGVLMTHSDPTQSAPALTELQRLGVPYRVSGGGNVIEVPVERVNELRLQLAGAGVLPKSGTGFEIFEKPNMFADKATQDINYRRALAGELERTVGSLDMVASARVHLALPKESAFLDEQQEPTASVVVGMRGGGRLPSNKVRAITYLVASGVERLTPENVSVIDQTGNIATPTGDPDNINSAGHIELERNRARQLEQKLIAILEPIVGVGKVRAQANVELNMRKVSTLRETYDPNAVLISENKSKSEESSGGGPGGIPGAAANLPGGNAGAAGGSNGPRSKTQTTTNNYQTGKSVETIEEPVGTLLRQSVAIVVDHSPAPAPAADADPEADPPGPVPRTPEEMAQIISLAQATMAFDADRGDTLDVQNAPFDTSTNPAVLDEGTDMVHLVLQVLRYLSLPIAVLLVLMMAIRPGIKAIKALQPPAPDQLAEGEGETMEGLEPGGPMTVAQLQAQLAEGGTMALPDGGGGGTMRSKLLEAARDDPKTAALILRDWLDKNRSE